MTSPTLRLALVVVGVWLITLLVAYQLGKGSGGVSSEGGVEAVESAAVSVSPDREGALSRASSTSANGSLGARVPAGATSSNGGIAAESVADSLPANKEIDVPELIASMRTQFGSGSAFMYNASAMLKIMAPIADLSGSQIFEALDEVAATVKDQQRKMIFHQLLLGRLAEVDGEAAMNYVAENLSEQSSLANGLSMTVMAGWAQREPDQAWRWFIDNRDDMPSGPMGDNQLQFIFSGMAAQDVEGAFRRLEELDGYDKARAVSGIAMSAGWNSSSRDELLERAAGLPDELRDSLYQGVFSQWAVSSPEEAVEWVRELPEDLSKKVAKQGSFSLLYSNPELGAEFMLENATEEELPNTYANIVGSWGSQNPNAAGEWLNEQPQGPGLDAARARFAQTVVQRDPFSAMEWAKTVEAESQRESSIRQVYTHWHGKNPTEADGALDSSGLSQEQISKIREAVVPPVPTER